MRKLIKRVLFLALIVALIWTGTVIADRQKLSDTMIRLHIVADSDEALAQELKLQVRTAILERLKTGMADIKDVDAARIYLQTHLPELEALANRILKRAGVDMSATASLAKEAFSERSYDTFALPAGVYEALRIVIGEGSGENWWCVAFPQLCLPTTVEEFQVTAVDAGFGKSLTAALSGTGRVELRFFVLDVLGRVENFFFRA